MKWTTFRGRLLIQELQCLVPGGTEVAICQLWSSNRWRCYSRFLKWNVDTEKGSHSDSAGGKREFLLFKKNIFKKDLFTHTGCFLSKRTLKLSQITWRHFCYSKARNLPLYGIKQLPFHSFYLRLPGQFHQAPLSKEQCTSCSFASTSCSPHSWDLHTAAAPSCPQGR